MGRSAWTQRTIAWDEMSAHRVARKWWGGSFQQVRRLPLTHEDAVDNLSSTLWQKRTKNISENYFLVIWHECDMNCIFQTTHNTELRRIVRACVSYTYSNFFFGRIRAYSNVNLVSFQHRRPLELCREVHYILFRQHTNTFKKSSQSTNSLEISNSSATLEVAFCDSPFAKGVENAVVRG